MKKYYKTYVQTIDSPPQPLQRLLQELAWIGEIERKFDALVKRLLSWEAVKGKSLHFNRATVYRTSRINAAVVVHGI
jgi:hypothetical protein